MTNFIENVPEHVMHVNELCHKTMSDLHNTYCLPTQTSVGLYYKWTNDRAKELFLECESMIRKHEEIYSDRGEGL